MAAARIICTPTACCVQPTAYVMVPTRCAFPVEVISSATLRKSALGVPQILSTISGVYRSTCFLSSCSVQRGCFMVGSTRYAFVFGSG